MLSYTTTQGDTWDLISLKMYGNEFYVKQLIEANTKHIGTTFFSAGIKLNIPTIDTKQNKNQFLPPWKR